jgi:glycosyltransferase involved in cell wall biosynthesis
MMQHRNSYSLVILACAMPPPVFGQSVVNAAVRDGAMARSAHIITADISAGSIIKNAQYHWTRLKRVMGAAWMIICNAKEPKRKIYMVTQVSYGILYNHLLLGLARLLDYKIILHHHDSGHTKFHRPSVAFLMWLIGPGAVHVTLGPAMAEDLKRYKQVKRVIVSQNARIIPDPNFQRFPRDKSAPLIVGHMSNLSRAKGLNLTVETIVEARSRGLDVKLVLAGPCDGEEAEATLKDAHAKLGNALDYRGPVAGETKDRFFRDIDVFLFPTIYKYEAQPLVILEAMSYSAAVIVAERGYTAELVGQAGDVFAGDAIFPKKAADRIEALLINPDDLPSAQSAARSRYVMLRKIATEQFDLLIDVLVS